LLPGKRASTGDLSRCKTATNLQRRQYSALSVGERFHVQSIPGNALRGAAGNRFGVCSAALKYHRGHRGRPSIVQMEELQQGLQAIRTFRHLHKGRANGVARLMEVG
jgi:hypothetical protein